MTDSPHPHEYEIVLRGHLAERWSESFPGLSFTHRVEPDGTPVTVLHGSVVDEAELHGLLARIRDLGIPLILVRRMPNGGGAAASRSELVCESSGPAEPIRGPGDGSVETT